MCEPTLLGICELTLLGVCKVKLLRVCKVKILRIWELTICGLCMLTVFNAGKIYRNLFFDALLLEGLKQLSAFNKNAFLSIFNALVFIENFICQSCIVQFNQLLIFKFY